MHLLPLWGHSFKSVRSAASRYEKYVRTWDNMGINSISWCQCKEMTHLPKRHQQLMCGICVGAYIDFMPLCSYIYTYIWIYIYMWLKVHCFNRRSFSAKGPAKVMCVQPTLNKWSTQRSESKRCQLQFKCIASQWKGLATKVLHRPEKA